MARLRIKTDIDRWVTAAGKFGALAEKFHRADVAKAGQATFDLTQDYVHVITGSLKLSGKLDFEQKRGGTKVLITYGGESGGPKNPVTYAAIEWERGGPHDWMTPAITETADLYPEALAASLLKALKAAFR